MRADFHSGACFINVCLFKTSNRRLSCECIFLAAFVYFKRGGQHNWLSFHFVTQPERCYLVYKKTVKKEQSLNYGAEVCALREIFQDDISTSS